MFFESLFVFVTFCLAYLAGWQFSQYYFTTQSLSTTSKGDDSGARRLFSLVFGACCNTILLVLFELLDILTFDFRLSSLKAHITLLVIFMLCAIPCYHTFAIFRGYMNRRHALLATAASQLVLVYILLRMLPAWPGVPEPADSGFFSLRVAILRTGVLGVCVIAVLSGFGTVDFPYSVMRAFVVPVNPFEVKALQTQLEQIREQIREKKARLESLTETRRFAAESQAKDARNWFNSAMSTLLMPQASDVAQIKGLNLSVEGLVVMEATLAADVAELLTERDREKASGTFLGRVMNILGYGLAAFCLFKMLACIKSVLFGEDFTSDPVTRALSLVVRLFSGGAVRINVAAASHYITLLFVGFVSFNSLRAFLKHMRRLATSVENLVGTGGLAGGLGNMVAAGGERMMLLLGALLCAYTVSSVMLLRAQLPVAHRGLVTRALGFDAAAVDSEFDGVHRWFNGMQLISLVSSLCVCYWHFKNKKANIMDLPLYATPSMTMV